MTKITPETELPDFSYCERKYIDALRKRRDHLHRRVAAALPRVLTFDEVEANAISWVLWEIGAADDIPLLRNGRPFMGRTDGGQKGQRT